MSAPASAADGLFDRVVAILDRAGRTADGRDFSMFFLR